MTKTALTLESRLVDWLKSDAERMSALTVAAELRLSDWCLSAGFVRNLVWDRLHGYAQPTPLTDLDLIHFDAHSPSAAADRALQARLGKRLDRPWSVKNQARMHQRNNDAPYHSTADAMRHWPEVETATGVRLDESGQLVIVAPFGLDALFAGTVTLNRRRPRPDAFRQRLNDKAWLHTWPQLQVVTQPL